MPKIIPISVYCSKGQSPKDGTMSYIRRAKWTAKQVTFLETHWDTMSDEKMADILGKTTKSIRRKRERMLLKKAQGRGIVRAYSDSRTGSNTERPISSEPDGTPFPA